MKKIKFDGSTPKKVKLSDVFKEGRFPCALRIVPIPSRPDREGFTSWVAIEQEGEDAKTADQYGPLVRVDARLVVLDVPSLIYYGGGLVPGEFELHLRRGAPPKVEHTLTQYLNAADVGVDIVIPVGAEYVEITQGEGTPILNRASFELWTSDGPTRLSQHLGISGQTRVGIGGANLFRLLTAPAVGTFFQVTWIVSL